MRIRRGFTRQCNEIAVVLRLARNVILRKRRRHHSRQTRDALQQLTGINVVVDSFFGGGFFDSIEFPARSAAEIPYSLFATAESSRRVVPLPAAKQATAQSAPRSTSFPPIPATS